MIIDVTLEQLFGANASQDADKIVIHKKDLYVLGLSDANFHKPEQLLVALLLLAHQQFEGTLSDIQDNKVISPSNIPVTYSNHIYELFDIFYWKKQFIGRAGVGYAQDTFVIVSFESYQVE